jgi:phosphonate transport system substrate-binding protein
MKTIQYIVVFLVAVCISISTVASADSEETLRIVFIAYQNPEQVVDDVEPVVAYLEKELGLTIKYNVATNYAAVVEALKNNTADMGFMGPLQYVMAHAYAGARPILGEVYKGKATYTSRIFVRKDSGVKTLADLKGKSIAFVDPISSSGYLYPMELFKSEGLVEKDASEFFKRIYFAGGDEQAIRAVYNGFVDAAAIGQFSFSLLRPEERDEVIFVGESKPLPSHCVVVRKGLGVEKTSALQNALLKIQDGPNKGLLKNLYGVDGYVKVTHESFKEVEEIARDYDFIK